MNIHYILHSAIDVRGSHHVILLHEGELAIATTHDPPHDIFCRGRDTPPTRSPTPKNLPKGIERVIYCTP